MIKRFCDICNTEMTESVDISSNVDLDPVADITIDVEINKGPEAEICKYCLLNKIREMLKITVARSKNVK